MNNKETDDPRIEELEKKVAFQDGTIADLNEVVIAQANDIRQLKQSLEALQKQMIDLTDNLGEAPEQTKPPHY